MHVASGSQPLSALRSENEIFFPSLAPLLGGTISDALVDPVFRALRPFPPGNSLLPPNRPWRPSERTRCLSNREEPILEEKKKQDDSRSAIGGGSMMIIIIIINDKTGERVKMCVDEKAITEQTAARDQVFFFCLFFLRAQRQSTRHKAITLLGI